MQKIVISSLVTCILLFLVLTGVQRNTIQSLSRSVEEYRLDFEQSRRANERYADAYREATETNTKLGECLSKHISTISQLREQLAEIRTQYERTRTILEEVEDLCDSDDNLDDIDIGNFSGSDQCTMK